MTILTEAIINAKADWLKAVEYHKQCSHAVTIAGKGVPSGAYRSRPTPEYTKALNAYRAAITAEQQALSKYRSVMARERFLNFRT